MESKEANSTKLKDILAQYGYRPRKQYSGYDMYLSPFRQESNPSFKVDNNTNKWQDFGSGTFGSPIDLVMKLENVSFSEAMKRFEEKKFNSSPQLKQEVLEKKQLELNQTKLQILKVTALSNKTLLGYTRSRGIDDEIAYSICKEVYYKIGENGKNCFAVGFQNNSGGIELRNPIFKGCNHPKDVTIINNNSSECAIFEGFFDLLSYLQLNKDNPEKQTINMVVLNSTALVGKAIDFLKEHKLIHSYLDNDKAGRITLDTISKIGPTVIDESIKLYPNNNDLNEFIQEKKNILKVEKIHGLKIPDPPLEKTEIQIKKHSPRLY